MRNIIGKFMSALSVSVVVLAWAGVATAGDADRSLRLLGQLDGGGGDLIRFSPDSSFVFTSGGGISRVWNLKTLKPVNKPVEHSAEPRFARFADRGRIIITGNDGGIRRWDVGSGDELLPSLELKPMLEESSVSDDGRFIAGVAREANGVADVVVREGRTGKLVTSVRCDGHPEFTALSEDGSRLVIVIERGIHERGFLIWNVQNGRQIGPEIRTEYDYRADVAWAVSLPLVPAAFGPDGKHIAICDKSSFRLYDASTGTLIARSKPQDDLVLTQSVGFTGDGKQVIVFDSLGISGWNAGDAKNTMPSVGSGLIVDYDVSADGKRVAVLAVRYGENGMERGRDISVWDWAEARQLCTANVKDGSAVGLNADGHLLAVGSDKDGKTLVWRLD